MCTPVESPADGLIARCGCAAGQAAKAAATGAGAAKPAAKRKAADGGGGGAAKKPRAAEPRTAAKPRPKKEARPRPNPTLARGLPVSGSADEPERRVQACCLPQRGPSRGAAAQGG